MVYYAVIDTNVFLSALLSKNKEAATVRVLEAVFDGKIIPLYHQDILEEYNEVFRREKFCLQEEKIQRVLCNIVQYGIEVYPNSTGEKFIDMDDLIFYEVVMDKRNEDAYLITGNIKHYPKRDYIVTPAEMMDIISSGNSATNSNSSPVIG